MDIFKLVFTTKQQLGDAVQPDPWISGKFCPHNVSGFGQYYIRVCEQKPLPHFWEKKFYIFMAK